MTLTLRHFQHKSIFSQDQNDISCEIPKVQNFDRLNREIIICKVRHFEGSSGGWVLHPAFYTLFKTLSIIKFENVFLEEKKNQIV